MYRTLSLIFKNAKNQRALPFVTKTVGSFLRNNFETTSRVGSFISSTHRCFNTGEHKFEKIAERGPSGGSSRQGKLNIKTTLNNESALTILTFIQDNVNSMNDGDYMDAIFLISNKLENDVAGRLNVNYLEKSQGFQQIKRHIQTNFDRLSTENYSSQVLLIFASQLITRGKTKSVFEPTQIEKLTTNVLQNLETNYSKMSLQTMLNVISLVGLFKNINANPYLKERSEDIAALGYGNIYRILRRITSPRISEGVRDTLSRYLVRDFMNLCTTEKMINKARAFNVVSKLDWMSAFSSNHNRLVTLLKDIRSQAENHDQQSILQMIEGLTYFDDFTRNETLKEFYDIVTMTIKHQPENVKVDFVLRFIEFISKYKSDTSITADHLKTIIDYATNSIVALAEANQRTPNTMNIIHIFLLMRKHKYYDREVTEKLYKIVEPYIHRLQINESVKAFKQIVLKVLGEEYILKLDSLVPETILKEVQAFSESPITRLMNSFQKAAFFGPKNPNTQEIFNIFLNRLDTVFQVADPNSLVNFVEDYMNNIQDIIPANFRIPIVEKIVNKFDTKEAGAFKNPARVLVVLNELIVPRERDDLKQRLNNLVKFISEDEKLKKNALGYLTRLSKESNLGISNATIYKFLGLIKEFSKNEEYIKENDRIISRLLNISFNFLFNLEKDSSITSDSISSISQFADFLLTKHPNLTVDIGFTRGPRYFKAFSQAHINSTALNKALMEFLRNSRENERAYLSNDLITILDKLNRADIPQEEYEPLLKKFISSPEKAEELFNTQNIAAKIALFKLYANLNKRRYAEVIPDDLIKKFKNSVVEDIVKTSSNETQRLQGLLAMNNLKGSILNYGEEAKEINAIIKTTFQGNSTRKVFRQLEGIFAGHRGMRFATRLYLEFSLMFEKETAVDKNFLLKVLDKFTNMKWTLPSFYNKVITDYERNYDFFNPYDHAELIQYFARVELNKEDVLRASAKNINTKILSDVDKFTLFNSLVKLGFTNQEWRETILDKLVSEIDFNFACSRISIKDKFQFLINLWKLEFENWPAKRSEILEASIQTINKYNKFKVNEKNIRNNVELSEDWLHIIRRAPFFNKFDADLQSTLDSMYKFKVEREEQGYTMKILSEYLKAMGHTDMEFQPTEMLCDFFLPETKTAIVIVKRNMQSIVTKELNITGQFIVNILKNQGLEPVVVYTTLNEYLNKESHSEIVSFLESLKIPNKVKDGNYNFSSVEKFKKVQERRRSDKVYNTPAPQEEANVSDEE